MIGYIPPVFTFYVIIISLLLHIFLSLEEIPSMPNPCIFNLFNKSDEYGFCIFKCGEIGWQANMYMYFWYMNKKICYSLYYLKSIYLKSIEFWIRHIQPQSKNLQIILSFMILNLWIWKNCISCWKHKSTKHFFFISSRLIAGWMLWRACQQWNSISQNKFCWLLSCFSRHRWYYEYLLGNMIRRNLSCIRLYQLNKNIWCIIYNTYYFNRAIILS